MAALQLALILLLTVLASAILDQIIPKFSLPLIQIALGVVIALFAQEQIKVELNPELFLVLFVAPLLFHEAQEADKVALWRNRGTMLSYAIGLVVAIVLVVGFVTNLLIPSIPLAAAFALGAALGPTDPLAVASVSSQADIPNRLKTTLKGESLLNDASGIVSFQFAVAAVVTGSFSALEATGEFLIEFFGALAIGIVFGYALARFSDKVRDLGLETTTFHVALEICTPIIAYLLGEAIGVSGIILVVACGITMSMVPRDLGPSISRMNIVSSSVWEVLTFALNGIVFVMLGTQLPLSFGDIWVDEGISNIDLVIYIVIITVLMHGIRFIWSLASDAIRFKIRRKRIRLRQRLKSAAILTLAGSKGTITLAIMFSLPTWVQTGSAMARFPQRDLLIFLACGVILLSLLLATFIVPILAPREKESNSSADLDAQTRIEIFRSVIEELTARQTDTTRRATSEVIARYNDRISRSKNGNDVQDQPSDELRITVLQWEQEYVFDLIDQDEVDPIVGYQYLTRIARLQSLIEHGKHRAARLLTSLRRLRAVLRKTWLRLRKRLPGDEHRQSNEKTAMRNLQLRVSSHIVERLQDSIADMDTPTEQISALIMEYQRAIRILGSNSPSISTIANRATPDLEVTRLSLRIELEKIQEAYEDKRLSREAAQQMRENVYIMAVDLEDYV